MSLAVKVKEIGGQSQRDWLPKSWRLAFERKTMESIELQSDDKIGWFYKLALLDFELFFEVKMQESEGV